MAPASYEFRPLIPSIMLYSIAFLSFGLGSPEFLSMCTGISWSLFGGCIIALYLKYPDLFDK